MDCNARDWGVPFKIEEIKESGKNDMKISKKISYTILALTVSAQIGIFGTPQTQIGDRINIQTLQNLMFTPNLAHAAGAQEFFFDTHHNIDAVMTYIHNGERKTHGIGVVGWDIYIDGGTEFTITISGEEYTYTAPYEYHSYTIEDDGSLTQNR